MNVHIIALCTAFFFIRTLFYKNMRLKMPKILEHSENVLDAEERRRTFILNTAQDQVSIFILS